VVKLLSTQETWLKALPEQASTLKPHQLVKIVSGQTLAVRDQNIFEDKGGHFKVVFDKPLGITLDGVKIAEMPIGYIYGSHWKGISAAYAEKAAVQTRFSPAGSSIVLQPAPLLIQNDNKDWGDDGSASNLRYGAVQCGLTSAAMLIASIWPNAKVAQLAGESEGGQFENWVAGQFKRIGAESTSMEGHVAVLAALGIKSVARRDATIGDLKQALHQHPVIMGTAYKASGHFVCGVGVADKPGDLPDKWPVGRIDTPIAYPQDADQAGVIINCPYGHRDFSGSGNNWFDIAQNMTDTFGLHNVLTNSILERFWVDGGEESGWAVFVDPATPNAGNRSEKPVELSSTLPPKSDAISKAVRAMAHPELPEQEILDLITACGEWLPKFGITTRDRIIHFFAQCSHESMGFYWLEEQGDNAYFTENYEGRDDLGNTQPGDGAKFSGHGLIQVTGRANHTNVANRTGIDCVNNPKLLSTYPGALAGSLVWWQDNEMNTLCDRGLDDADVIAVTKRINGGTTGLNDRLNRTDKLKLIIL
jgi:putative chitinase